MIRRPTYEQEIEMEGAWQDHLNAECPMDKSCQWCCDEHDEHPEEYSESCPICQDLPAIAERCKAKLDTTAKTFDAIRQELAEGWEDLAKRK